jgi:ABC-type transport system substrate-binding protein
MKDGLLGKNKLLRQAIAYAIDPDAYIDLIRNGRGKKLNTVVPFSIAGSENDIGNQMFNIDIAKAKKLLADAGFPEGKGLKPIVVTFGDTSSTTKDIYEFFRAQLAQIGVQITPDYMTFPKYLQAMDDKNYQMALSAWAADYPDAENFYQLFFGKSGSNNSAFASPDYDKMYTDMRFMENGPQRFEILKKMSAILKEEAPGVPIYSSSITGLIQKWVKNFKRNAMNDRPFKYLAVDTQNLAKGSDAKLPN